MCAERRHVRCTDSVWQPIFYTTSTALVIPTTPPSTLIAHAPACLPLPPPVTQPDVCPGCPACPRPPRPTPPGPTCRMSWLRCAQ